MQFMPLKVSMKIPFVMSLIVHNIDVSHDINIISQTMSSGTLLNQHLLYVM